jgi:hypothetical protein
MVLVFLCQDLLQRFGSGSEPDTEVTQQFEIIANNTGQGYTLPDNPKGHTTARFVPRLHIILMVFGLVGTSLQISFMVTTSLAGHWRQITIYILIVL